MQVNNTAIQKINRDTNIRFFSCILLTISYVISGKLGLMLALPPGYASPIFPPAGIALAAALISGKRSWPWIFLGSLLLNLWVGYSSNNHINAVGVNVALIIAVASMLQAAIGGWGLRRTIGYPVAFDNGSEIVRFLLLAPIICLTSATLSVSGLSALGIIELENYVSTWASWWVGDTLGVLVMLPLVMIFAGEPRNLWQRRKLTVAVPILLTLALFVIIFLKVNRWENNDSLMEFRQLSRQATSQVKTNLDEQETVLDEMAALFVHDAKGHITREEFHRFAQKTLERFPMIQALEWAVPVDAADRINFVATQRKTVPGFEIRERNANGELRRAAERSSFYPVTYVEPLSGNEPAIGFDLASNASRLVALTTAAKMENLVVTPAIHLVQDRQQQAGILLLLAVNPQTKDTGMVLTVLRMGDFLEKLLQDTQPMLYTRLIDSDDQKTIYDNFSSEALPALYEHSFSFGTRNYRLETAPTPAYVRLHHGWQSWGVLATGIFGTSLLGALLLLGTGYTARMKEEIEERTRSLKESESRFRSSFESSAMGMALVSIEGRFVDVNTALCQIVGYSYAELTRKTFQEITHPDDVDLDMSYAQQLIAGIRNSYQMEKRYYHKEGHIVWIQLTGSTVRNEPGELLYFIAQIQDITERKQADELLRKSAGEIEDLYNHAPCGYHSINEDGVFQRINDTELRWLGYTRDEVVGKLKLSDLLTPASNQAFQKNFVLCKKNGFITDFENEMVRKDGSILYGLVNSTLVYDASNEHFTSRSTVFDITERKKTDDTLHSLFAALEHSPLAVIIADTHANILYISPRFTEITGYPKSEVVGCNLRILQAGRISKYTYLEMWSTLVEGKTWRGEILNKRKQGGEYWEDVNITPVRNPAGEITNYVVVSADISERKAAEEKMHHLANYDPLTDLPNRSLMDDRLHQAIAAAKRDKANMALMFLDLDKFKPINDTLGHAVGDLLLKEASRRMLECVRESDTVGRIGGDEFVVLLPTVESDQHALLVAEKIRHALNQPFTLAGENLCISSSIGVAIYPEHGDDGKTLVKNADAAMYCAKESGRNNVRLFKAEML